MLFFFKLKFVAILHDRATNVPSNRKINSMKAGQGKKVTKKSVEDNKNRVVMLKIGLNKV